MSWELWWSHVQRWGPYTLPWALLGWVALTLARRRGRRALVRWREARKRRRRSRWAARAEVDAAGVLRRHGYKVLAAQVEHAWMIAIDGEDHEVEMRADYLVARKGKRYIAEVKTGQVAPNLTCAPTRRQLLEYAMAYPVDGVLLLDMETEMLHEVCFGGTGDAAPARRGLGAGLVGAVIGAALVWGGLVAGWLPVP